jgi:hypothetical protein
MKLLGSTIFYEFLDWLGVRYILKKGQVIFVLSQLNLNYYVKFWFKLVKDFQIQLVQIKNLTLNLGRT